MCELRESSWVAECRQRERTAEEGIENCIAIRAAFQCQTDVSSGAVCREPLTLVCITTNPENGIGTSPYLSQIPSQRLRQSPRRPRWLHRISSCRHLSASPLSAYIATIRPQNPDAMKSGVFFGPFSSSARIQRVKKAARYSSPTQRCHWPGR